MYFGGTVTLAKNKQSREKLRKRNLNKTHTHLPGKKISRWGRRRASAKTSSFSFGLKISLMLLTFIVVQMLLSKSVFAQTDYRQFFSQGGSGPAKTVAASMATADVSEEFDCPLFSNSPYADILKSINSLESAIQLFPTCKEDGHLKASIQMGKDIKDRVIAIRQSLEGGKGLTSSQAVEDVLGQSAQFQELLVNMSQSSEPCYKDPKSRSLIFKINDALQSISPLAMEIVTKMPGLNSNLLPVVAGSGALVQGISTLEKVLEESATLDVSNSKQGSENRIALIKNTCQFMKVYNKVDYLQMNRAERSQKIHQEYHTQMQPIQEEKKSLLDILDNSKPKTSPEAQQVAQIKVINLKMKKSYESAKEEFNSSSSEIGICAAAKTLASISKEANILVNFQKLTKLSKSQELAQFKINKYNEFYSRIYQNQRDAKACATDAKDWIASVGELVAESERMIEKFEKDNSSGLDYIIAADKLAVQASKAAGVSSDHIKKQKFVEISVFEPSEISKRMRSMPRYLFNGPDGGLGGYVPNGPWKKYFFKNGPVFDFLKNNESQFTEIMAIFNKNFAVIMKAEDQRIHKLVPRFDRNADIIKFYQLREAARIELSTLNYKTYPKGSSAHQEICDKVKMTVKSYQEAKDMLASSHYMCQMIDPVLKEEGVSIPLKNYCRTNSGYKGFVDDLQAQKLNQTFSILLDRKNDLDCE